MTSTCTSEPIGATTEHQSLMGLARLMTMAFEGVDLMPLAKG